jgi:hypothetical protein
MTRCVRDGITKKIVSENGEFKLDNDPLCYEFVYSKLLAVSVWVFRPTMTRCRSLHQKMSAVSVSFKLDKWPVVLVSLHTQKFLAVSVSFLNSEMTLCAAEFAYSKISHGVGEF